MAVVIGLIFLQLDIDQEGVLNVNSVMFLGLMTTSFANVTSVYQVSKAYIK